MVDITCQPGAEKLVWVELHLDPLKPEEALAALAEWLADESNWDWVLL